MLDLFRINARASLNILIYVHLKDDEKDCLEEGCCWNIKRSADAAVIGVFLWISTGTTFRNKPRKTKGLPFIPSSILLSSDLFIVIRDLPIDATQGLSARKKAASRCHIFVT